jgi:uncharacterized protein (TIGR02452 family)
MSSLQELINWDHVNFIDKLNKCTNRYNKKKKLKEVTKSNYQIINYRPYPTPWTYKYKYENYNDVMKNCNHYKKGIIVFDDLTTDDAIVKYSNLGHKVIALNYANATTPGGGYLNGAIAQEEELCRQYPHLYNSIKNSKHSKKKYYPLSNNHLLITHDIKRYRENSNNGYKIINIPNISAGFITTAAPNMRSIKNKKKQFHHFKDEINQLFKLIFTAAYVKFEEEYNVLVIGAWGCGAFAPLKSEERIKYISDMANLMAVAANNYRYMYDYISVSIPDKNSENYQIFKKAFSRIV